MSTFDFQTANEPQLCQTPPRFSPGQFLATPGAIETLLAHQVNPLELLGRHVTGDWGDVCTEDAQTNEEAVCLGFRVFSVYRLPPLAGDPSGDAVKVWLITEADRCATTLLLPEEY